MKSIADINHQLSRIARSGITKRIEQALSIGERYIDNITLSKQYRQTLREKKDEGYNNRVGKNLSSERYDYAVMYANQEARRKKFPREIYAKTN